MAKGWILVGSSCYGHPIIHKEPTRVQISKLKELELYDKLCILQDDMYPLYKSTI